MDFDYDSWTDVDSLTLQVGPWETNLDGSNGMTGHWSGDYASLSRKGTAHTENELLTMTRVSTSVVPVSAIQ